MTACLNNQQTLLHSNSNGVIRLSYLIIACCLSTVPFAHNGFMATRVGHAQDLRQQRQLYDSKVKPLVEKYCYDCHSGDGPEGDFDFNVVIRSILYNQRLRYLSYSVGGAITAKSDPEKEYQECLLKAIAMKKALISKD